MKTLRSFLSFALLSGLGWLCDFTTFSILVKLFDVQSFSANFFSSYVGVTFVWFTSLNTVFKLSAEGRTRFLVVYWGFQFFSITAYSQLLQLIVGTFIWASLSAVVSISPDISAKIFITPLNLITNFLFMKYLARYMRHTRASHV